MQRTDFEYGSPYLTIHHIYLFLLLTQINAYIAAENHGHYGRFVNNFLSTNSVKCLGDITECLV